jgi:hypothetical protein
MSLQFIQILEAKERGDWQAVNEASLNRVFQHTEETDSASYGILTSWRAANPKSVNLANFNKLQQELRSAGLGFFKLKGQWPECQDSTIPYDECPQDKIVMASEPSLFVPNITKDLIVSLMGKYKQDSVMYSGEETGGEVVFIKNDGTESPAGNFNPNTIGSAYSTVKGRPFTFEYVAHSWSDVLAEKLFNNKRVSS